jgi:hypothetical protein
MITYVHHTCQVSAMPSDDGQQWPQYVTAKHLCSPIKLVSLDGLYSSFTLSMKAVGTIHVTNIIMCAG